MSEMIERVARAFLEDLTRQGKFFKDMSDEPYDGASPPLSSVLIDDHVDLMAAIRVAINAMREPTKKMVDANPAFGPIYDGSVTPWSIWETMIDAALRAP